MKMIHKEFAVAILLHICFSCLTMSCLGLSTKHSKHIKPAKGPQLPPLAHNFADERLAVVYPIIQKFKNSITSDPHGITKTWVGSDICKYKGFFCDNPPYNSSATAVASIDFNGFQLSAPTLDGFLDQFPDLALFHANSNRFSGTISPNITLLPYLYEFDISNNLFSGSFPISILKMPSLLILDIRFNSFTGSVPEQLFTEDINALFINNNDFIMKLPENVASNSILFLTLANNKFFGPIPSTIFKSMSSLTEVLFLNNLLTDCLPYEVGLLKEAVVFDVGNNELTGQLPLSLGCLENLEVLNLAGNMFYGMVPEVICLLGNLGNFSLSDNYFTGVGPSCLGLINNGVLDARNNCIQGLPFQRSMMECVAFISRPRFCQNAQMPMFPNIPCWFPRFQAIGLAPSPS